MLDQIYSGQSEMAGTFTYRKNEVTSDVRATFSGIFDEEEDNKLGWDKMTVKYANEHRKDLLRTIKHKIYSFSDSLIDDAEDVFGDLMIDLYKAEDYNMFVEGNITTGVGSYVAVRLGYIVQTFIKEAYDIRKNRKDVVVKDEDGETIEIFDTIPSYEDGYDRVLYACDVENFLKPLEFRRYEFGIDLFQALYVRISGNILHMPDSLCHEVLSSLSGKSVAVIRDTLGRMMDDEDIISAVHAIDGAGTVDGIKPHVYGVEQVDAAIKFALQSNVLRAKAKVATVGNPNSVSKADVMEYLKGDTHVS